MHLKILACAAALMTLAGCVTVDPVTGERDPNRAATGAIIGAIGGAAAGTLAGGDDRRNAIIGAGVGALAGAAIGDYMDDQEQTLRARLAGTNVGVQRVSEDRILLVFPADLTFDFDSADVKQEFRPTLRSTAGVLRDYPQTTIDIVGHADSVGSDAYNQQLSERRAMAVATVMLNNGVIRQRVVAMGRGESAPIADNATPDGRARNRRVEVLISAFR